MNYILRALLLGLLLSTGMVAHAATATVISYGINAVGCPVVISDKDDNKKKEEAEEEEPECD